MIERYRVLAERIRFELTNLEKVIIRGERAMNAYQNTAENQDLLKYQRVWMNIDVFVIW